MSKLLKPTRGNLLVTKTEFKNYCRDNQEYIFDDVLYDRLDIMTTYDTNFVFSVSKLYSYVHTAYNGIRKIYLEDIKDYAIQYINSEIASRKHYLKMTGGLK